MTSHPRITVEPNEPIGTINPYLHGHFAEHLGELITPGICVDPDCDIPSVDGLRMDVIEALRLLHIPVLRWPGGCFADHYHWRDGIGLKSERPARVNHSWGMTDETNAFGTHEFIDFCRLIGAEPYFAGNVGSGTVAELRDWVEYCNFASRSSLADQRRANGADQTFGVRFWGIGNESWGCGGNMSPEQYAGEFLRYRSFVRDFSGTPVFAIACGPDGADWQWTRRFFETVRCSYRNRMGNVQGYAAHYYCGTAGTATEYSDSQWLELLTRARAIEGVIAGTRAIMDEYDPEQRVGLIFDEWGAWHPVEAGKPESGLYQQNTIRDACVAALTLDLFHNHCDTVIMANLAQIVNVLQALLLVEGDKCIKTPTYHVFDLYQPHKGAVAVRTETQAETISDGEASAEFCRSQYLQPQTVELKALHGSASVKDGMLCVTLVNTHPTQGVQAEVKLDNAEWRSDLECVKLSADDIHAHNTFDLPDRVALGPKTTSTAEGNIATIDLPPGGILRLRGDIV